MKAVSNATMATMLRLLGHYAALLATLPDARSARHMEERRKINRILARHGEGAKTKQHS